MNRLTQILFVFLLSPLAFSQLPEKAIALHQAGKLNEAVTAYREFLTSNPNSLPARSNLAVALLKRDARFSKRREEALRERRQTYFSYWSRQQRATAALRSFQDCRSFAHSSNNGP